MWVSIDVKKRYCKCGAGRSEGDTEADRKGREGGEGMTGRVKARMCAYQITQSRN